MLIPVLLFSFLLLLLFDIFTIATYLFTSFSFPFFFFFSGMAQPAPLTIDQIRAVIREEIQPLRDDITTLKNDVTTLKRNMDTE